MFVLASTLLLGGPSVASPDPDTGISFRMPVDFATGASPSSAAFNAASGDQSAQLLTHTGMSDSVTASDLDADGDLDAVQTNVIAGSVSVFLGDGRGRFASPRQHPVGAHPTFVVAGHLDADAHADLAVADFGSGDVVILRGRGDGTFQTAFVAPVPFPRSIAIGRINDDLVPDLAVASGGPAVGPVAPAGGAVILFGDPRAPGAFGPAQIVRPSPNNQPVAVNAVAIADLDGRGRDDLAVAVGSSRSAGDAQANDTRATGDDLLVYLNRDVPAATVGQLPFDGPSQPPIRVGGTPDAIAVADLNDDGSHDLAVMGSASGDVTSVLGDGAGRFRAVARNATVGGIPRSLAVGDVDGDAVPDAMTANFHGSTVSVLRGKGDGAFDGAVDFWSGSATTSAALGDFDGDDRLDIVAGRLRDDHLALLLNDSPAPGDGVVTTRDIYYGPPGSERADLVAAHRTLDVYTPPPGTPPLAGDAYPVVLFVHGGAGISGDKTMVSYLMRSLARAGLVAVSTNYRLGPGLLDAQTADVAEALRWTLGHAASHRFCGDADNVIVFGHSWGAGLVGKLATEPRWREEQRRIRAVAFAGFTLPIAPAPAQPPALLLSGNEGLELAATASSAAFAAASSALGSSSEHVVIAGRDHLTLVTEMAMRSDPARTAMLRFIRSQRSAGASACGGAAAADGSEPPPPTPTVSTTGARHPPTL